MDGGGNVYVVDTSNNRIQKFTGSGAYLAQWGTRGSPRWGDISAYGMFYFPEAVAADASGHVYVADTFNERIQKFTSTGAYLTQWGMNGSGDGRSDPLGVAVDASGNVYVADTGNHRIQKFAPTLGIR